MEDEQLLRYSRQIMLTRVGYEGQERLLESSALIIGLGGLGSPVAMYLAAAGVGRLVLADHDTVDLSNLQRQIAHTTADIGRPKVESAADRLRALNPGTLIETIPRALDADSIDDAIRGVDIVLDCCDNFATRFAVNEACARHRKPLVSGAAIRMEGQVTTFLPGSPESPCYRCLYRDESELADRCTQLGVLAPVVGIIGSVQATEAIKALIGLETLMGKLLLLDAQYMEWRSVRLAKDPQCPVCGT